MKARQLQWWVGNGRTQPIQYARQASCSLHLVHSDFQRKKIICKFGMLNKQHIFPPQHLSLKLSTTNFLLAVFFPKQLYHGSISAMAKLHLLMTILILSKLKFIFLVLLLSDFPSVFDKVDYDYTENLLFCSHIPFILPQCFLCYYY